MLLPKSICVALWVVWIALASPVAAQPLGGVSLAGAEFGDYALPGSYGYHYTYPTEAEVDYYLAKGFGVFRVPFRWERLQHSLHAPLDAAELARLETIVHYATGQGAFVILDPHNYARYHGDVIGSASVPHQAFADFWSRLAGAFVGQPRVIFGLMTEPHDMPTEQWLEAANAAITAIRAVGAHQLILVPGNGWDGAGSWHSDWYGTPNAEGMLSIEDPDGHFAFEVHQYLDADASGKTPGVVHPTIGSERLAGFSQWLRDHGFKGFLGEFAVARESLGPGAEQIGDEALEDLLAHLESNSDVWLGWSWWAGGPWWGDYMFALDPEQLGGPQQADRPQMALLEPHLLPEPRGGLPAAGLGAALLGRRRQRRKGRRNHQNA